MALCLDTHCHLDALEFASDRQDVIDRAKASGISGLLIPGVKAAEFTDLIDLCHRSATTLPGNSYALGIHPLYTPQASLGDLSLLKDAIADADCYVMNSDAEGFGLVILESMINKTPWIARNIAGAKLLSEFGEVYETEDELVNFYKQQTKKRVPESVEIKPEPPVSGVIVLIPILRSNVQLFPPLGLTVVLTPIKVGNTL